MRIMDIPPFPRKIEIPDLEFFIKSRLGNKTVMWPKQAVPLLGVMCHPNDLDARNASMETLWSWRDLAEQAPVPDNLSRIQENWVKVADVFHHYCDLVVGRHQERRGGASIGKAVTLVAAKAKARGTAEANLWKLWGAYKDVAHLVTAAALVCAEVDSRLRSSPPGPAGLSPTQFMPFQMTLLMPDLVLAVAQVFQTYGLGGSGAKVKPVFDPATVWHIPTEINVEPITPPMRAVRPQDVVVLNERRAGNRGRANKTTPVSK